MSKWSTTLSAYYQSLQKPIIPEWYECMNPYEHPETMPIVDAFLNKYYDDDRPRTLALGINPGRFGSGITGISFTDPINLKEKLKIPHDFEMRAEISSAFIYEVIDAYGGPEAFFHEYFISAVYPLGFLHEGKNINYYDLDKWRAYMLDPIIEQIERHLKWNVRRDRVICIGQGENLKVLTQLNNEFRWFEEVIGLPHPRWIMQYRRKQVNAFIQTYLDAFR